MRSVTRLISSRRVKQIVSGETGAVQRSVALNTGEATMKISSGTLSAADLASNVLAALPRTSSPMKFEIAGKNDPGAFIIACPHWGGAKNYTWANKKMFQAKT